MWHYFIGQIKHVWQVYVTHLTKNMDGGAINAKGIELHVVKSKFLNFMV